MVEISPWDWRVRFNFQQTNARDFSQTGSEISDDVQVAY